jgi:hypothetical protein
VGALNTITLTTKEKIVQTIKTKTTTWLVLFAVVYGLIFINYIDIITPGGNIEGYHLWLVLMYFAPFAILSVLDIKNLKLTLGLGFLTSVMNDVFYGAMQNVMGTPYDLGKYYNLWLIPQSNVLFNLNLGFANIPVQSWMMAASIYLRFAVVFFLLDGHKYMMNHWRMPAYLALKRQKIKVGGLKPIKAYEPEIFVIPPESITVEQEVRERRRRAVVTA